MEFTLAFFREFARSAESKQMLTPFTTKILKSIVLPNTILSFPAGLIYGLIVAMCAGAYLIVRFIRDYQLVE